MQASLPQSSQRFVLPGMWLSGLLLATMLFILATALNSAKWTDGLEVLAPVVLGGFLLGMAMSFSRWSGLFPVLHSLVTGLAWVLAWVSRAPQVPQDLLPAERILFIGRSLTEWVMLLFGDEPVRSNLVFILELSLLLWWLGYLAAWAVFREGRVWRAIAPISLVMLVNVYFGPPSLRLHLGAFIVCGLLLAVRSNLSEQEIAWRESRVRYPTDIQLDFLRDGFIFAVVVMLLALLAPNAASSGALSPMLEPLREPWQSVQAQWGRLFSSLNYQVGGGRPAFGDSLTLGGPRNLGDTVIMDVRSTEGRYWRAVSYDTYTGRRWLNSSNTLQSVASNSHVRTPEFEARREVTQTIVSHYPAGNVLFAAPQALRVSLKAEAMLNVIEMDARQEAPLAEITMLHRRGAELRSGDTYLAVSSLSTADVESLQEAGAEYPDWVREKYLQLPPDLPPRVADLAREVTADAATPFDKAVALEEFLRTYPYNDQIQAPPPNADGVDYFLFGAKQGYCDYYASAFAVMARTLGIPARVSAGYAQGEYLPETDAYRVTESDGHSWPEAFFPSYGWVEFEPTASETEIVRQHRQDETQPTPVGTDDLEPGLEEDGLADLPERDTEPQPAPDSQAAQLQDSWLWLLGIGGMLLLTAIVAFLLVRPSAQRTRKAIADPQLAGKLYGRLVQWATRLRLPILASQTPNEHALIMGQAVPEGRAAILSITDLYVHEQFSPHRSDEREAEEAVRAWDGLQPLLRRYWLKLQMGPLTGLRNKLRRARPAAETDLQDE